MITVLAGTNQYAISQKLAALKRDFIAKYGEAGVEQYRGEQLEVDSLGGLLASVSLFASNRLVIVREMFQNKAVSEKLVDLRTTIPDEIHIVLVESSLDKRTAFYKMLKKEAELLEFTEPDDRELTKWIIDYTKSSAGTISPQDASLLVQYVGADQLRLKNELDKLIAFDSTVTKNSIAELVERRPEDTIFQLLDSALSGKTDRALQILEGLEAAHEDPYQVASMLVWQAQILAVVQSAHTQSEADVAKAAKINPFVVKKTRTLVSKLSKAGVNKIIDSVAVLDRQLKTNSSQPWQLLEATIAAL